MKARSTRLGSSSGPAGVGRARPRRLLEPLLAHEPAGDGVGSDKPTLLETGQGSQDRAGVKTGTLDHLVGGARTEDERGEHPQPLGLGEQTEQLGC